MAVENSALNDSAALPESNDSMTGGSNGAMADTTMADLKAGYSDPDKPDEPDNDFDDVAMSEKRGGFVGRPEGWDR